MLCRFLFAGLRRVVEIHESFHAEIDEHVPTHLISPLLTRDLADLILLQPYDGEYERIGSRDEAFM